MTKKTTSVPAKKPAPAPSRRSTTYDRALPGHLVKSYDVAPAQPITKNVIKPKK